MKAIVNKYLNARQGGPSLASHCPYYHQPGDVLTMDDLLTGEEIDGNAVWYHATNDGCYYWSGGIAFTDELLSFGQGREPFTEEETRVIYQSAVNELSRRYMAQIQGFKGLAAGYKITGGQQTDDLALIFYIDKKSDTGPETGKVPATIAYRGYSLLTDVREIGPMRLQNMADATLPYPMGGSLSPIGADGFDVCTGTRGLLVKWSGKDYLFTCYHVACQEIIQGRKNRLGELQIRLPAALSTGAGAGEYRLSVSKGAQGPDFDYALLESEKPLSSFAINIAGDGIGIDTRFFDRHELGNLHAKKSNLTMYGAGSQRRRTGMIIAYHSDMVLVDDRRNIKMNNLIECTCMSQEGDSGAPVIDENSGRLVGFVLAGDEKTHSFIMPFTTIAALGINPKTD